MKHCKAAFLALLMAMFLLPAQVLAQYAPYGQSSRNYALTFSEEFNTGSTLSRWNDHIWYESSNPAKNYVIENGALKIWPQRDASNNFFNRTIDTDGKFSQRYGYFEIEAKLPYGKGVWPAFWLLAHIGDRRPEIDIMEAYPGGGPDTGWSDTSLHPNAYGMTIWKDASVLSGSRAITTPDLSAGFHKYAVRWEAGKITFYFDGVAKYSRLVSLNDPMYILLSLWFGSASGEPDATTPVGKANSFEINYVRVWRILR
ncbi:glycoside hydrolase family 16 protein [Noviherbaspirillum malthae]|uniref:glycoside hydrolase family 16 protein n=1 Tax=Noviherbaspirillum malthae TaxID=1260987 RepID=UPI00188E8A0A|nr:glycoside hydrolase family 16 protein [Noviherbaspirillum malthae]